VFEGRSQLLIYHIMFGRATRLPAPHSCPLRTTRSCSTRSRADEMSTSRCGATTSTSVRSVVCRRFSPP